MKVLFVAFLALLAVASALKECPEVDGTLAVSIPNPNDCKSFFKCNQGVPVWTPCPEGLAYRDDLGVCDFANNWDGCHLVSQSGRN